MNFFSKVFWSDTSLSAASHARPPVPGSDSHEVVESSESQGDILDGSDPVTTTSVAESSESQAHILDGSDATTTASKSSLDQFNLELRSTLATLATLDNDSLITLSKDDEYLRVLKQLVGPLALNTYACGALAGHLEGLPTDSGPQHHFTIHFVPNSILSSSQIETQRQSLLEIVNRNIATEVKDSVGQHLINIKLTTVPLSLVCTTHSPTLVRLLQPSTSGRSPRITLSNQSPNIFKDSHLANRGWWVRPEGEELYILHFVYMSTHYLKAGTSMYLEAAIRRRYFNDMKNLKGRKPGDIAIGAMHWRFFNPDYSLYSGPAHRHRYYEGWQAWLQVGIGDASMKEWLDGKKKFEMRVLDHNNYESRVNVEVLVYRD